jgi:hypothetical protein
MKIPANTAIIGRIPGYNTNIDMDKDFEKELLKGVTFIDLRPMSYAFGDALQNKSFTDIFSDLKEALKNTGLFQAKGETSKDVFQKILKRMKKDFNLREEFDQTDMIRIVAANDSTFTETFSNSYDEQNSLLSPITSKLDDMGKSTLGSLARGAKGYSHSDMIELMGSLNTKIRDNGMGAFNAAVDLATGAFYGMDIAAPTQWQSSSYTSTLTVFVKLISPAGTPECIERNILEPILFLLAAASPITYGGVMYGFPLLWDIHAQGITNFRLGGIAAMSIIRGSFETTFNKLLQPTVIDVRLTLVPVLNDFASQVYLSDSQKSMYTNPQELGAQNPADIRRGILNDAQGIHNGKPNIVSIKL